MNRVNFIILQNSNGILIIIGDEYEIDFQQDPMGVNCLHLDFLCHIFELLAKASESILVV
jgi:hypothetical protein